MMAMRNRRIKAGFKGNLGLCVEETRPSLARVVDLLQVRLLLLVPGSARQDGTTCCYGLRIRVRRLLREAGHLVAVMAGFGGQLVGTGRVRLSCTRAACTQC
jgi:hypothetical protein